MGLEEAAGMFAGLASSPSLTNGPHGAENSASLCFTSLYTHVFYSPMPCHSETCYTGLDLDSIGLTLQSEASGCRQVFVKCFLKFPIACFGSTAAAVQPYGLWNSQKAFCKTSFTT